MSLTLDPELMTSLAQLEFVVRRVLTGRMRGERRSRRRGSGTEFADYRDYAQGDDPRFIDWNIYGRLDRLFLKLFLEEEDLRIAMYLDTSASMSFGDPDKLLFAKKLAAALAYVGLVNLDRVAIEAGALGRSEAMPWRRGRSDIGRVLDFLDGAASGGETDLAQSLKAFSLRHTHPGVKIVLSDFMDKSGYEGALKWLGRSPGEVHVFHILSPQEIKPDLVGDLALVDSEDGAVREVSIGGGLLRRYRKNLASLTGGLRDYCLKRGFAYFLVPSSTPLGSLILDSLRRGGALK